MKVTQCLGLSVVASVTLVACSGDPAAPTTPRADGGTTDAAPTDTRAQTLSHHAGPWQLTPGQERTDLCESWTLHNEEPLYVNTVDMQAMPGMHHSNWFFVPDTAFDGPDGSWPCRERGFDQGAAAALGGVFFAQSTQVTNEAQRFPAGTAIVLPPHARVIGGLHLLNASPSARTLDLTLTAHTLRRSEVRTRLSPFYLEYHPLSITPRGRSQFDLDCDLAERNRAITGGDVAMRFFYGLAHYHSMGAAMRVTVTGGRMDGQTLYETDTRQGDSWARTMEPAQDISGATSLHLTCLFENTTDRTVRYGNGNGEMCIWFGFTDSAYQWALRAPTSARNTPGETRDGVTYNTSRCTEIVAIRSRYLDD